MAEYRASDGRNVNHFTDEDMQLTEEDIAIGTVRYDTLTRRLVFSPASHYGIGYDLEPVEIFGELSATTMGREIQSLAQVLPENALAVSVYNAVHAAVGAMDQDENVREEAAQSAAMKILDEQTPERTENP
jgi:hypothetical protein